MSEPKLLGRTLTDAQKNLDLFTWFFFTHVDEPPSSPGALVFRPNGPAFHRLVKLELTLAPDETITAASIHLLRSFIAGNTANAGDLVKSFIRYGNAPALGDLSQEIMMRSLGHSAQPVLIRGDVSMPSGPPSKAFRVFLGEEKRFSIGNLSIENQGAGDSKSLVLFLGPSSAKAPGWCARMLGWLRGDWP